MLGSSWPEEPPDSDGIIVLGRVCGPRSPKAMAMLHCSSTCRTEIAKALDQFYLEKTRGFPRLDATRAGQGLFSANPIASLRV